MPEDLKKRRKQAGSKPKTNESGRQEGTLLKKLCVCVCVCVSQGDSQNVGFPLGIHRASSIPTGARVCPSTVRRQILGSLKYVEGSILSKSCQEFHGSFLSEWTQPTLRQVLTDVGKKEEEETTSSF